MKGKRFLGLLLIVVLAVAFAVGNLTTVSVSAKSIDAQRVTTVSYSVEKLLADFGVEPLEEGGTRTEGRTIKYRLTYNEIGATVEEDNEAYNDEAKLHEPVNGKVTFNAVGGYTFYICAEDDEFSTETADDYIVKVLAAEDMPEVNAEYNTTTVTYKADVTDYKVSVESNAQSIRENSDFVVPSLEDIIDTPYFDYDSLEKTVYYCEPNSTSFTKGNDTVDGELTIKLSEAGTYGFYVLFKDVLNRQMTTTGLVMGNGGWYEKDDNGEPTGSVVIPVFQFYFSEVTAPEVVVKASENAYIGLTYKINAFTITANNYETVYKLYYNANKKFDKSEYESDDAYMAAVKADADTKDITEVEEYEFDEADLTFNPANKGYYYVEVMVKDTNSGLKEEAMSRPIACQGEAQSVVKDPEFLKYNLVSIIFLGVAVLCAIALVLILVFVPKEPKTVELTETTEEPEKKKK